RRWTRASGPKASSTSSRARRSRLSMVATADLVAALTDRPQAGSGTLTCDRLASAGAAVLAWHVASRHLRLLLQCSDDPADLLDPETGDREQFGRGRVEYEGAAAERVEDRLSGLRADVGQGLQKPHLEVPVAQVAPVVRWLRARLRCRVAGTLTPLPRGHHEVRRVRDVPRVADVHALEPDGEQALAEHVERHRTPPVVGEH